ncbi:hypothetical protein FSO04_18755 [Paraburkholderia madseniana]|uniref:Uncharacterized protein n=1 Tax=Paraburkholderia madseniana TaxID=2599607 RepID=A0A6N6WEB2_9BURK|nr:hypothetical protein [Paraburkholderia madseniana]KAE8758431.1 hypothetical protein FSO04_18755 [Paraburkholderia madseniana]
MFTRKLDWLRVVLRASPKSDLIRSMIGEIAQAVVVACTRLDCGLNSTTAHADSDEEIRREATLFPLGSPKKPKRNKKI